MSLHFYSNIVFNKKISTRPIFCILFLMSHWKLSVNPYAVLSFAYPSCRFLSMCAHRPFIIIFSRLSLATVTKVASNYRTRFSLSNGGFFFSLACLDRLVIYRWNDVVPTYLIFWKSRSVFFIFRFFSLI